MRTAPTGGIDSPGICETARSRYEPDSLAESASTKARVLDGAWRLDGISAARMERIMRVNVMGSMLCAREAVKRMSTRHGGKGLA